MMSAMEPAVSMTKIDLKAGQDARPLIVQGSKKPVFSGRGPVDLVCRSCGQILVQGYEPRCLIALDLQCAGCKTITRTDSWPIGEPLPQKLVTLGDAGRFLVSGTVDMTGGAAFTCDQEIGRVAAETGVRPSQQGNLDITSDGLTALQTTLDLLTDGAFGEGVASTKRAILAGNDRFLKYPPAWAVTHLLRRIDEGLLDLGGVDGVAVVYLQTLLHLVTRWQHHPLFSLMSKALVYEFHHSVVMLTVASYLADHGNQIGFTNPRSVRGRSPDLFVNLGPSERVAIEVKAPAELQWPNSFPPLKRLDRVIEKQLKNARGQIASGPGGIVVVGSSAVSADSRKLFEASMASLVGRGKVSSRMAAVAGVYLGPRPRAVQSSPTSINSEIAAEVFIHINPRFNGPGFLKV